jgi:protein ImuA
MTPAPRPLLHPSPHRVQDAGARLRAPSFAELLGEAGLHEVYAAPCAGPAATAGALLAFARQAACTRPMLWARQTVLDGEMGRPYPPGLAEFGVDPASLILARAGDHAGVLQAGLEGARCRALGAVLIELWGEARALDLTASRRFVLAAEASGTPVFLARYAARPQASAAQTRWLAEPAASRALEANAPGPPAFTLTLLRHRGGVQPVTLRLEWNRDRSCFEDGSLHAGRSGAEVSSAARTKQDQTTAGPPLPGAVVPFPAHAAADTLGEPGGALAAPAA